jgi:hypothetical protein
MENTGSILVVLNAFVAKVGSSKRKVIAAD